MGLATRSSLIATTLAIGAIAAPGASAGQGMQQSGISPWAGPLALQQSGAPASTVSPWAGPLALEHPNYGAVKSPPTVVSVTAPETGFDYADAGIGAGVVAGLTLLGAAGALTIRRHTQPRHP